MGALVRRVPSQQQLADDRYAITVSDIPIPFLHSPVPLKNSLKQMNMKKYQTHHCTSAIRNSEHVKLRGSFPPSYMHVLELV